MMCVAWDRKEWAAAKAWLERGLPLHPEWESSILVRRAGFAMEMSDWAGADADLRRSMDLEPQNPGASDALLDLADKLSSVNRPAAEEVLARWRESKGASSEYLYQNRLGNWHYSAGDYLKAAEYYRLAVSASPDRPVMRSNYALAAEALRTRGERRKWLDEAITNLAEASRLDPSLEDYRTRLVRLTIERAFIQLYGEPALELLPTVTPLRVEVRADEVKVMLDAQGANLSKEAIAEINAWRTSVMNRIGVVMPGVSFTTADDLESGQFRMSVMEKMQRVGSVNGLPLLSAIVKELDVLCQDLITEFLGHQETVSLLRTMSTPATLKIVNTPHLLTSFVQYLRQYVTHGQPITDIPGLALKYLDARGDLPDPPIAAERVSPAPAAQQG
jgi:tetratricopeptide (TPR) repeat protein